MLFAILGALLALFSLIALLHRRKKHETVKPKQIPGLQPSDPEHGNSLDIKEKRMGTFVRELHETFGPIASFWEGKQLAVSIASPEYMKEQRQLSDISIELFGQFRALVGDNCMGFCDLDEIMHRRKIYDNHFKLRACIHYAHIFVEIAHEYVDKWKNMDSSDQIGLSLVSHEATLKAILRSSYGEYFKDEDSLQQFQKLWTKTHKILDKYSDRRSENDKDLQKCVAEIRSVVIKIIENRRNEMETSEGNLFLDVLLTEDVSDEQRISDSILFLSAGHDTTGNILMWAFHEIALYPEVQAKLHDELETVLKDDELTLEIMPKLKYAQQVIDETMRVRVPDLVVGRVLDKEMKLGGFVIPAKTTIYQAMGVMWQDPNIWNEPQKFDPDRFSHEKSKSRHAFAFKPFGFAGKRQCPGQTFAATVMLTFLVEWCRRFRFELVPGQSIKLSSGLVPRPEDDIWVTLHPWK